MSRSAAIKQRILAAGIKGHREEASKSSRMTPPMVCESDQQQLRLSIKAIEESAAL